jgi:hypothetical protein
MASTKICEVPSCGAPYLAKGFCRKHYQNFVRNGAPVSNNRTKEGAPFAFIKQAIISNTDECIFWPYAKHRKGFGLVRHNGKTVVASRLVCELAFGAPKDTKLQAAHSCGNGHRGCVNPRHLRWASRLENAADQIMHGTRKRGKKVNTCKLSEHDVRQIRALLPSQSMSSIAAQFGVSVGAIKNIETGRNWAWLS